MSEMSYYDMNKCLCKELKCEFEKFEESKELETLKGIKDIIESMVGLTELEAAGAMRDYLEDNHGYNSRSGEFEPRHAYSVYNAARKSTMPNRSGAYPGYTYTGIPYGDDYDMMGDDYMYMNRGRDDRRMDGDIYNRGRSRDSRGRYNDGHMGRNADRDSRDGYGIYNMAHKPMKDKLTDADIKEWMENLESENGEKGPMWTKDEIEAVAKKEGIKFDKFSLESLYAMANVAYSDYCGTGEKFGVDTPAFYVSLAKEFLTDPDSAMGEDGGDEKLAAYYEYIVEH